MSETDSVVARYYSGSDSATQFSAGGTARCYEQWAKLTSDKWILDTIQGYEIEFFRTPFQLFKPRPLVLSPRERSGLDAVLTEYLECQIIEPCADLGEGFYSNLFTRPKRDGSVRVIFNLSALNDFVTTHHFKMETVKDAILLMTPHCYMGSIDFKNAYYAVPIAKRHRKYLRFQWNQNTFQFTVFPQGLSTVPRAFTKIMKPPFAFLREKGFTLLGYIDDTILIESSANQLNVATQAALDLFTNLGLTINYKKSVLHPSTSIEYLGFILDSVSMTVRLADRKKVKIRTLATKILLKPTLVIQELAEFIGNLVAATIGVYRAPLYYKSLECSKNLALTQSRGDYSGLTTLSAENLTDVRWWEVNIMSSKCQIHFPEPCYVVTSDASNTGWGAWMSDVSTGGDWSQAESEMHINWLELKAAYLALCTFCPRLHDCHIRLRLDNTTAISCIMKYGSTTTDLRLLTKEIFAWAETRNIHLSAAHIPGRLNTRADKESRTQNLDIEWQLRPEIFDELCRRWGTPEIDLFATRLNTQLKRYVAWRPDPGAAHVDAFTMSWKNVYSYAFPPFSVLTQVLQKTRREGASMLLIAPSWATKPWFPMLKSMAKEIVDLPQDSLQMPQNKDLKHRLRDRLRLKAYKL